MIQCDFVDLMFLISFYLIILVVYFQAMFLIVG